MRTIEKRYSGDGKKRGGGGSSGTVREAEVSGQYDSGRT